MSVMRFALAAAVVVITLFLPAPHALRQALADPSGATFLAPPNYNFEAGPLEVGPGPTNHDFADGGTGWSKLGTVTYSGGIATLSGSAMLTSSTYTLADNVQSIKIRYKAGASASVGILMGGSYVGTDNLSCVNCTAGEWVEKYIGVYTLAQGESVKVRFIQTSGTTEIDWAGTQWIPFQEWSGPSVGPRSQPKQDPVRGQFMELKGTMYSGNFHLTENRLEFDYAIPLSGGTGLSLQLRRVSDSGILASKLIDEDNPVPWTREVWTWSQDYVGVLVYVRLSDLVTKPSWIDNVGINLAEAASRAGYPTFKCCDPFDTSSGQFTHSNTDILVPGKGIPLEFTRSYHSMVSTNGDLGHNWRHSYSTSLRIDSDGSVTVYYASGGAAYFKHDSGSYTPPAGVFDTLIQNQDNTYTLTTVSLVEYDFSEGGKLTSMADRNGNTTTLNYDVNGRLESVEDPGGRTLTFDYDASDRITKVTDPLPNPDTRTIEFTYDSNGDLTQVKDVKGGTTTYTYSNHRMTSLTDSNDHLQNENIYDGANRVLEQTDALGGVTCIYYGAEPAYTSAACPGVTPAPEAGQTITVDPRGNETTYGFDTSFRTTDIEDDLGNTVHYEFDADNNITCVTDQRGNKTGYSSDSAGNVTQIIDAENTDANCDLQQDGVDWTFTYTANNDIDLETDPLDRETDYVYDGDGNLTQVIRKDDLAATVSRTCFTRDGNGLMTELIESTTLTDCTGNKTKFEYDTYGNQTAVVNARFSGQPTPPKTDLTYDLGGRLKDVTNELSHTTTYTYGDQNNVLTVADNLGNTTSNTYDAKGTLATITDANRQPVSVPESGAQCGAAGTGDGVDDDADTVADDGCPSAIYSDDDAGRLTEVIDALGQSTTYGYDGNGNRTSVTNANRQPVGPAESGAQCGSAGTGDGVDDDADTVADDGCPSVIHAFDALNRLQSTTDALARVTSYQYDAAANLSQRTDAKRQAIGPAETGADCGSAGAGNGVDEDADTVPDDGCPTAVYTYDALGRLTRIDYSDEAVDYTYDDVGSRLTMVDDTGTTSYAYDDLDRPASVTFPGPETVSYTYDNVGNRTKITYPDSKDVDYTYDEAGNLETVTDWLTKQTVYTYDNAGNLTKTQLPNGAWTDFGYDTADRLTSVANKNSGGTISSFTYTLGAAGSRTQMVDLAGTHTYDYDDLYRLTEVTYPDPETDAYTYDAVGNRLSLDSTSYTYDDADQMLTAGAVSYGYDANGNQTSRGSDTYTYDHENRLTNAVIGGVTSSSVYNGDGLRMSHTENSVTTSYAWDVAAGLPVVIQDDDNTYVYGLDLISATDGSGVQTYSLNDGLGSTTDLTDGSANPTDAYSYDVFGTIRSQSGSSDNYWLFTGEQRDGQPGVDGGVQRLPLDVVVSSTNLTGATVANLDDDPDSPDANWATATTVADTSLRVGFPSPPGDPTPGADLQEFRVLLRKDAAGGNDPTYDIELWETGGGAPLATLASGVTLSSDTGEVVSVTWDASLLGSADGSAVEVVIVGDRSNGSPSNRRTVEVGAVEWNAEFEGTPPGSELYYLRARYYDSETGRFLGQDPVPAVNLYAYVGNNPTNLIDPSGNCPPTLCVTTVGGCAVAGPGGCVVGLGVGIVATGAVVTCGAMSGCREAVGSAVEEAGGLVEDAWGGVTSLFGSKPKVTPIPEPRLDWRYLPPKVTIEQPTLRNLRLPGRCAPLPPRLRLYCRLLYGALGATAAEQLLENFILPGENKLAGEK